MVLTNLKQPVKRFGRDRSKLWQDEAFGHLPVLHCCCFYSQVLDFAHVCLSLIGVPRLGQILISHHQHHFGFFRLHAAYSVAQG